MEVVFIVIAIMIMIAIPVSIILGIVFLADSIAKKNRNKKLNSQYYSNVNYQNQMPRMQQIPNNIPPPKIQVEDINQKGTVPYNIPPQNIQIENIQQEIPPYNIPIQEAQPEFIKPVEILPFRKKNMLTKNEMRYYANLIPIAKKYNFCILTKIRVADIIEPLPRLYQKDWWHFFGKIKSKHVDFVLADRYNLNPILLIEIDDKTHDYNSRIERDNFVDQAYYSAGIKILHLRDLNMLEDKVCNILSIPKQSRVDIGFKS